MRITLETPFCLAAVNEIFLDGILQSFCIGADDVKGVVERYAVNDSGGIIYDKEDGDAITEILTGKVQICLNKGWSFRNNRFYIDVKDASEHWQNPDTFLGIR